MAAAAAAASAVSKHNCHCFNFSSYFITTARSGQAASAVYSDVNYLLESEGLCRH